MLQYSHQHPSTKVYIAHVCLYWCTEYHSLRPSYLQFWFLQILSPSLSPWEFFTGNDNKSEKLTKALWLASSLRKENTTTDKIFLAWVFIFKWERIYNFLLSRSHWTESINYWTLYSILPIPLFSGFID